MSDSNFVYNPTTEISTRALFQAGAYILSSDMNPEGFFEWKSGVKAPVYTDCRVIQGHPGPFRTLVKALSRSIENNFGECVAVAGMAEAGLVWSAPVSIELGLPHAFVRKTRKSHGRGRMVEGNLGSGDRVVLVDDLMAGGGTACEAIGLIEDETGAEVIGVQTIVNWGFVAMRQRFEEVGVPYCALVSYPQILDTAVKLRVISGRAATELKAFYRNPTGHAWDLEALRGEAGGDAAEAI